MLPREDKHVPGKFEQVQWKSCRAGPSMAVLAERIGRLLLARPMLRYRLVTPLA
jgi:hypothetical protein